MPVYDKRWGDIPDRKTREQFNDAVFCLQRGGGSAGAWGLIMANVNKRWDHQTPLLSIGLLPVHTASGSGKADHSGGGVLTMGVNYTEFNAKLSRDSQQELLAISVQKIFHGRLGVRGERMEKAYGKDVTELAFLLYLQRFCPHNNLALDGFITPEPKMFDPPMPPEAGIEDYAALLYAEIQKKFQVPEDWMFTESVIEADADPNQADQKAKELIQRCESDVEGFQGRGFVAGDGYEFLKTLFQPAQVRWEEFVHCLEQGKGRSIQVPTRKRPARRDGPNYFGTRWVGECNIGLFLDVSGSRTRKQLATIFPELRACNARGATVVMVQVDADVQKVEILENFDADEYEIFGRGGTTLQPAIERRNEIAEQVDLDHFDFLIVSTDGFCDNLDFGDCPGLVLLDSDGADITEFRKMVSGSCVDVVVLQVPSDEEDPNAASSGN